MRIACGFDHAGVPLRDAVLSALKEGGHEAATKVKGIRAATVSNTYRAHQSVEHDDLNVMCLGARVLGSELA